MIYIGIDPGAKGGFSMIRKDGVAAAHPWDECEFILAMRVASRYGNPTVCALEHVHAMPGQGVTSMFTFGKNFGFIQGVLSALGIPYELVTPRKWKKEFSITADKNQAVAVAQRLFPGVSLLATPRCRKPHDGMAESLLLAEYARRRL